MKKAPATRWLVIITALLTLLVGTYSCSGTASASTSGLQVSTTSLPAAGQGQPYTAQLAAAGGTGVLRWVVTSGEMPTGLILASDGEISGTPSEPGSSTFSVQVSDSAAPTPQVATASLSLTVQSAAPLSITSDASISGVENHPVSAAMSASGGTGPYTWSTTGPPLPVGVTLSSDGHISGTPTEGGTFQVTVVVTDSSTPTPQTATGTVTLAITPTPAVAITQASPPGFTQGQGASFGLTATGGVTPYTWSLTTGQLPPGLTLDASSGTVDGAAREAGTFKVTVEATDSSSPVPQSAIEALTLTVSPSTPKVTTTTVPGGSVGAYYSQQLAVSGGVGPYNWSVSSGSLPPGVTLDPSGYLSGTPSEANTYSFVAAVTDSALPNPQTATQNLTLLIQPPANLSVHTTSLPDLTEGEQAQLQLQSAGGTSPFNWSITAGSLPPGMSLQASTGTISGTPTKAGNYPFTVGVQDSSTPTPASAAQPLSVTVAAQATVTVTVPTLPAAYQGSSYYSGASPFTAAGGQAPYTWTAVGGTLPPGIRLEPGGYLDGTPTSTGRYSFTVQATDSSTPSANTASAAVTLTVGSAPRLSVPTTALAPVTQGSYAYVPLDAIGGSAPYNWAVTSGTLPPGLTVGSQGAITGTPTTPGKYQLTVSVSDSTTPVAQTVTRTLWLDVQADSPLQVVAPSASGALPDFSQGLPSSQSLQASGGVAPYSWSAVPGSLPAGLSLGADGTISGTPTAAGSTQVAVQVTDSSDPAQTAGAMLTFVVDAANALAVSTQTLPAATQGIPYRADLAPTGGTAPYTWSLLSGQLPLGLALSAGTGALTGTPQTTGSYTFTVGVTDSSSPVPQASASSTLHLTVNSPAPLAITSAAFPAVVQGQSYPEQPGPDGTPVSTYTTLTATGGDGSYTWTVIDGSLPPGMSLDPSGIISGTPTSAGVSTFTIQVSDKGSWGTLTARQSASIFSNPAPALTPTGAPLSLDGTQGEGFYQTLGAAGGVAPYTWSTTSGTVPPGLTLAPGGDLQGVPSASGSYTFTAEVTDSATPNPATATEAVTVVVKSGPALSITSTAAGSATQASPYYEGLQATGGTGPYTWAVTSGALPAGLDLSPFGSITGTPTGTGAAQFTVTVTDSSSTPQTARAAFDLTVAPAPLLTPTTSYLPQADIGQQFYSHLEASGGVPAYTWTVTSGKLPPGLGLDTSGDISGTATTSGTYSFTVEVTDSATPTPSRIQELLAITVPVPTTLALGYSYLPAGQTAGDQVVGNFNASGGVAPYTWSVKSGALPPGIDLSSTGGYLNGKLTTAGTCSFTVEVTDSATPVPDVASEVETITVNLPDPLSITTTALPAAQQGTYYDPPQLSATGGLSNYSWSIAAGSLPRGIRLDRDGLLSGTPTGTGNTSFTVQITDGSQTARSSLSIAVAPSPPVAVTTTEVPPAQQGQAYFDQLDATGGVTPYTWSVVSGALPPGMTLDRTTGVLSGEMTATGAFHVAIAATDASTPAPQTSQSTLAVDVTSATPLAITSTSPAAGTQGTPYSKTLTATGGVAPYRWGVLAGKLPAGLAIDQATGEIYGIPTTSGPATLTVEVTDSARPAAVTATEDITIDIAAGSALAVGTASLPTAYQGQFYDTHLDATGGIQPYTWSLKAGILPAGLSLSPTGEISGTATAAADAQLTVEVTDAAAATPGTATRDLTLSLSAAPPLTLTDALLPAGTEGDYYDQSLSPVGGVRPYTWSVTSGSVPPGLAVAADGTLSGEATTAGTYSFTVTVTDSATPNPAKVTKTLTVVIGPPAQLQIPAREPNSATQGQQYYDPLQASGGVSPYTWALSSGSLPPGLTLSPSGVITGSPTGTGLSSFTVTVSDAAATPDTASQTFELVVGAADPLVQATDSLPNATAGQAYQQMLAASGGVVPYRWSVASGSLPSGVNLYPSGLLYGTPTGAGASTFTLALSDSATPSPHRVQETLTLSVDAAKTLAVASATLPDPVDGQPYDQTLGATGGVAPYTWAVVSGSLPAGLDLGATGALIGTPSSAGSFPVTVAVTDSATPSPAVTDQKLTVMVDPLTPLAVATPSLADAVQGSAYDQALDASGGVQPYTWSLKSGALPSGMSLAPNGQIYGTPTVSGAYPFEVAVADSATPTPTSATRSLSLVVDPAASLSIQTAVLGQGTVGQPYTDWLAASGGVGPYRWSVTSGALPPGLTLDASTGAVTGEPTSKGAWSFTVEVTDASTPKAATASQALSITVGAGAPLAVNTTTLPQLLQGQPYSAELSASGGTQPYTWTLKSGQLPAGLTLHPSGTISGTPAARGAFSFVLAVADSATPTGANAEQSYTLSVDPAPPLALDTASLVPATAGHGYGSNLEISGGVGPYSVSVISGSLPAGVQLGTEGDLYGTPRLPGTYTFTVSVTDSAAPDPATTMHALSLVVSNPQTLAVTPTTLARATQGQPYTDQLGAHGGVAPYKWALTSGSLPQGLQLDAAGTISGIPLGSGTATFEVQVTDSASATATATMSLRAGAAASLSVASTNPAAATLGQPYDAELSAAGGFAPYTWSIAAGSLPPGLTLSPAGSISGQPTAAGTSTFTAEVTDSASPTPNTATAQLTLTADPGQPLSIPLSVVGVTQGQSADSMLGAAGGVQPYHWTVSSGTLPAGLTLGPDGQITGIPTATGSITVTFAVTDSEAPAATATKQIVVYSAPGPPLSVSGGSLPAAARGQTYTATVPVTGGVAPYSFKLAAGSLPAGLSLDPSTGRITGVPTGDSASTFSVVVTDSASPQPTSVLSALAIGFTGSQPALSVAGPSEFGIGVNQPAAYPLTATGGTAPYTWSLLSGQVPPGTKLDASGSLDGTPTTAGQYTFTAGVTDSAQPVPAVASSQITVTVLPPPLHITTTSLPAAVRNTSYSAQLSSSGGVGTVTWKIASGSLPPGFVLIGNQIFGMPSSQAGDYHLTVQATDSATPQPQTAQAALDLVVDVAVSVQTAGLPGGSQGSAYHATLTATGGVAPYSWSISSGSLPSGLSLDPDGSITGTPTSTGTATFSVTVSDGEKPAGTATASLTLAVGGPGTLSIGTGSVPAATADQPYYQHLQATGGDGPYTWTAPDPLPAGLTLSPDGIISGTPTAVGVTSVRMVVTDSATPTADTANATLTMDVVPSGPRVSLGANPADGVVPLATNLVIRATQAAGDALAYTVDFGDGSPTATGTITSPYAPVSLPHTYQTPGSYIARVSVLDATTNQGSASSAVIKAASATAAPPVPTISAAPTGGMAPLDTAIDIGGTDPAGLPLSYTVDFGDGTSGAHGELIGTKVINHTYTASGTYTVIVQESDGVLSATRTATITVAPPAALVASAGDPQTATVNQAVQFDGSGSQPAGAIQTYSWDFGDGSSGAGMDASHIYTTAGTYTATLTIASGASTATATTKVTVEPVSPYGLEVSVSGTSGPLPGAEAMVITGSGQRVTAIAGSGGVATLPGLADGSYTVYVYQPGYQPGTVAATVTGGDGTASITLKAGPVAQATLSAARLTKAQILAAGIDPNAPGNQNVYSFSVNLGFGPDSVNLGGYICGTGFCGGTGFQGGSSGGGVLSFCATYCYYPTASEVDGEPNIEWLVMQGKATFLKEFFKVTLVVQNLAGPGFTLNDGNATLDVPAGMSLAPTAKPQTATVTVPDVPGGGTASADWYIRGDQEGSYPLTADYSAMLQPFGAAVTVTAKTKDPVKVWGASAVQMTVDADATAVTNTPYDVRVGLKNVSDVPVYNATVALSQQGASGFIFQPDQQLGYSTGEIQPGQTFWTPYYVLVPQAAGSLDLSQSFVRQIAGNADLKSTVITHKNVDNPAPMVRTAAANGHVALNWDTVPGATEYQIFTTTSPTTPFGATPVATVPAPAAGKTSQGVVIKGDPASGTWYAISSVVSGKLTMLHPLTEATASSVSAQPQTTLTQSNNGCGTSDVTVTAQIADSLGFDTVNPPQLTKWTYQIGSAPPVVTAITGGTGATEKFVVPHGAISRDGTPITVFASDSFGDGPSATATLGGCPYIGTANDVPDVGNPTIVIKGFGFGTGGSVDPGFATNGHTHYLQIADSASGDTWSAGGYTNGKADPCTAIVGYWTDKEVIVSPQINQGFPYPCNVKVGESLQIRMWPTGDDTKPPITYSVKVVRSSGGAPSVTGLSAHYGPNDGGTFVRNTDGLLSTDPNGTITVDGTNLADTQAVWFGQDYASPPASTSGAAVTVIPPAEVLSGGTNVQVTTPAGASHETVHCRTSAYAVAQCGGHYFFMQQNQNWTNSGSFGPYDASIGVGGGVMVGICDAAVTRSVTGQVGGTWTGDSQIWEADNSGLPSAVLGFGTVDLSKVTTQITFSETLDGGCDIPLRELDAAGFYAGLFLHIEGKVTASLGIKVTFSGLSIKMGGLGWVNGGAVGGGDSSIACKGTVISPSNLSALLPCLAVSFPASIEGDLQIGPELEVGYSDQYVDLSADIGTLIGAEGVASNSGPSGADICYAPVQAGVSVTLQGAGSAGASDVLPGPVQLAGDPRFCPFGKPIVTLGQLKAEAFGGSGTLSVGQSNADPVGHVTFSGTGVFATLQAVSDPFSSVKFTDCNLNGGQALYWWNGNSWQYVPDAVYSAGSPSCIDLTVTDTTTPSLAQITDAVFAVGVASPVMITTASLPGGVAGSAYPGVTLAATGGKAPYSWSVTKGPLPPGLSLDPTTGKLSGTPTAQGTYAFTVAATDSEPTPLTVTKDLSVQVDPAASGSPAATETTVKASASSVTVGQDVTYTATVTAPVTPGGRVDFLDGGADISTCTGVPLSGAAPHVATCTVSYPAAGSHQVTAAYQGDAATAGSVSPTAVTVDVTPASVPLAVTTSLLPQATVGSPYPATDLHAEGGTSPYKWSIPSGAIPSGLHLDPATGQLTGLPTSAGTYDFRVQVTDSAAMPASASKALSITVVTSTSPGGGSSGSPGSSSSPGAAGGSQPLAITTSALPHARAGSPYQAAVAAGGGTPPYRWAVSSGNLPAGIRLDPSTGVLSGTATAAGTYPFTVAVSDPAGEVTRPLLLTVDPAAAPPPRSVGYNMVTSNGAVLGFGQAPFEGSATDVATSAPIVGSASTPDGAGYWLVTADGEVFAYGDAPVLGSLRPGASTGRVVGMAAAPDGHGYWLASSDGRVFAFGTAGFYGSPAEIRLAAPIAGIAATPDGGGYWLVASDGGVFAYGDAGFFGSAGALPLAKPIVGLAATADGRGYWLVASDGGVFAYGDAGFAGSAGALPLAKPIVGLAATADGRGYWLVASDGGVFAFGDAPFDGSAAGRYRGHPVVAVMSARG